MKRILLAIEDYTELLQLEAALKKVGFDTLGVQNDVAISEKMVAFHPELLIITAQGQRVNGVKFLSNKLKSVREKNCKIVVLQNKNKPLNLDLQEVDAVLDSPANPSVVIAVISEMFDIDGDTLIQKLEKSAEFKLAEKDPIFHIKGGKHEKKSSEFVTGDSGHERAFSILEGYKNRNENSYKKSLERIKQYSKLYGSTPLPAFQGITRAHVAEQLKDFRDAEGDPEITAIDEERRAYARALLKKIKR